jgi:hypothetical protein
MLHVAEQQLPLPLPLPLPGSSPEQKLRHSLLVM